MLLPVRDAGHHHMADPNRNSFALQVGGKGQHRGLGLRAEDLVLHGIDVLDVKEHQICHSGQAVKLGQDSRRIRPEGDARGIQTGVDAPGLGRLKELRHKADLHKRLAAAHRDAAFLIKRAGLLKLL